MADGVVHNLSVKWTPDTGELKFDLPQCAVVAAGLLSVLEAAVKIRVLAPTVAQVVVPAPADALRKLSLD